MARDYRLNTRESGIVSRIDAAKESKQAFTLRQLKDKQNNLSNMLATKLIEKNLVETNSKTELEEQINRCIDTLCNAEEFEIQFQIAPLKDTVPKGELIGLYITAFIVEKLINHPSIVDIYGTDLDIYDCINNQIKKI